MAGYVRPYPSDGDSIYVWYVAGRFSMTYVQAMQQRSKGTFTQSPEGVGCESAPNATSGLNNDFCALDLVSRSSYLVTDQKIAGMPGEKDTVQPQMVGFLVALGPCVTSGSNSG